MIVRISATDWLPDGNTEHDAVEIARAFVAHGADAIDVSSGQVTKDENPEYGRSYQTPFADRIRHEVTAATGAAVIAVGAIASYDDVNSILLAGRADLCALGRTHLYDPHWNRAALWGVGASAALMAWMRPTDAVWVTLPLFAVLMCLPRRRRPRVLAALVVGLATGAAQWVVEAYVGFGGLSERLADASGIQGGLGWNIAVLDQLRTLGGRSLCRPCAGSIPATPIIVWWFVLPLLAAVGLAVAVRARRTAGTLLPLACATTAGIPYLFLIGYAAPRFLLPYYALLVIPVADALIHLVIASIRKRRPVAAVLVALGLAGHLAIQYAVLTRTVARSTVSPTCSSTSRPPRAETTAPTALRARRRRPPAGCDVRAASCPVRSDQEIS